MCRPAPRPRNLFLGGFFIACAQLTRLVIHTRSTLKLTKPHTMKSFFHTIGSALDYLWEEKQEIAIIIACITLALIFG